ncbi:MAG: efflux transporter outer membrane subunit [Candidatus Omnitrophica bacterium]|nr:efflux transporter outer membrane subunit [Candidatus Omnitrophota bacterium]MDD5652889.1 efflux transporter outer membrane subunit [Candidatus Omnitrophota bacterium]
MKRLMIFALGVVFLSGCSLAPKYIRPQAPVPNHWPSGHSYPKSVPESNIVDAMQLKWQGFFTDPKLQQIILMALQNNRDLRLAALNVERARALYGIQRSELFPVIDAQSGFIKQRVSADSSISGKSYITQQYSADLGITAWEVDFFGRIRNLTKQALEEYLNTEEARRSAQIALISEVGRTYLVFAADQANFILSKSTLEAQQGAYKLVLRRYNAKIAQETDLLRAQTQVDTATVDVLRYARQLALDKNALDLLAGSSVPEELLPPDLASVKQFKNIFPGLPSEVLLKRPDIMAAEHKLKGAYANIGAARAAFFPSISITTALGTASSAFSGLFSSGRSTWTYAPQVTMPIFDMRIWAAYRVSEADRKIALTQYEKSIQTAFREVSDVLAVQGTVDQQITAQQSNVDSAQKIYGLSSKRYADGIDSYLSVLDAQRSLYSAQRELIALQVIKLANEVRGYAVLGGGALGDMEEKSKSSREALQDHILSILDSKSK